MKKNSEESLKSMVYKSMYTDILEGKYPPGSVFTEKELVEKYSISKSPIREALIELSNEGFLKSIPRYGYEVLAVSSEEIDEVKIIRIILETGGLNYYFDKITADDIANLRALLSEKREEEISLLSHWERNTHFHLSLAECYGNAVLVSKLKSCFSTMTRAYTQYQFKRHNKASFKGEGTNHRALLAAIEKGSKDEALSILAADINDFVSGS